MSIQIETTFVKGYNATIERLLQQMGSRFLGKVRQETQKSEEEFWEQIGSVEAAEVVTRHGDSPQVNTPHDRRRVTMRAYDVGDFLDTFDKVQMLIDPTSTYVRNFVDALNRKRDDVIVAAFHGTAYTGKAGATQVTFPAANVIGEDFHTNNSGLLVEKLIEAKRLLLSFQNDPEAERWYIAYSANQLADLLNQTEVTSADYNIVRALVRGEINTYMGFEHCHSERLLSHTGGDGNDVVRECPVWTKDGVLHSVGMEVTTRVTERADKRFSWYAYARAMFGATRMQENKVLRLDAVEAVA